MQVENKDLKLSTQIISISGNNQEKTDLSIKQRRSLSEKKLDEIKLLCNKGSKIIIEENHNLQNLKNIKENMDMKYENLKNDFNYNGKIEENLYSGLKSKN